MLKDIQDRTDTDFPPLPGRGLTEAEIVAINTIHEIVTNGRRHLRISSFECTLSTVNRQIPPNLSSDKLLKFKTTNEATINLFGIDLNLGFVTTYFSGSLSSASISALKDAIEMGTEANLMVECKFDEDKPNCSEFYHKWLKTPEETMEQFEAHDKQSTKK